MSRCYKADRHERPFLLSKDGRWIIKCIHNRRFFNMPICFDVFTDPRILKCLHTFCNHCLQGYVTKLPSKSSIPCPLCRDVSALPRGDVSSLKKNFYIKNLIDFINTTSNADKCQWICSFCELVKEGSRVDATAKCITCDDFLCSSCADRHNSTCLTISHQVVSTGDLCSGKYDSQVRSKQEIPCTKHNGEISRYLCDSCNIPICRDCVLLDHRDHSITHFAEAVRKRQSEIEDNLMSLDKKCESMKNSKQNIDKKLEEVQTKETLLTEMVQRTTDMLVQKALRECEATKQLIRERLVPSKECLQGARNTLETKTKDLEDSLKFCRKVIKDGRDGEILFLLDTMKERLSNLQNEDFDSDSLNHQIQVPSAIVSKAYLEETPLNIFKVDYASNFPRRNNQITPEIQSKSGDTETSLIGAEKSNGDIIPQEETSNHTSGTKEDARSTRSTSCNLTGIQLRKLRDIKYQVAQEQMSTKITYVCPGKDDTFFAVDCNNDRIIKYSTSGERIKTILVKNIMTARNCESFLAVGLISGKVSIMNEAGVFSDTKVPIQQRLCPMCTTKDNKSIVVMSANRMFILTGGKVKEVPVKDKHGRVCNISPRSLSHFKESQYVVSDMKSNSLRFIDSNGTILKDYIHTDKSWVPGAITTDKLDSIFVACYNDSSLLVLNSEGQLLQSVTMKPHLVGPRSIAIVGDGRLAAARENSIVIFELAYTYHSY